MMLTIAILSVALAKPETVLRVIDGDTLVLRNEQAVRLLGVDAPEMASPNRGPAECFALEAAGYVSKMVRGKTVRIEWGAAENGEDAEDHYGRRLAYVYLPDGRLLNAELVRLGYARGYFRFPFRYSSQFAIMEQAAREAPRGLWKECPHP